MGGGEDGYVVERCRSAVFVSAFVYCETLQQFPLVPWTMNLHFGVARVLDEGEVLSMAQIQRVGIGVRCRRLAITTRGEEYGTEGEEYGSH